MRLWHSLGRLCRPLPGLPLLAVLAGCTAPAAPPVDLASAAALPLAGVIVSVRPALAPEASDTRGLILTALGSGGSAGTAPAAEFVVRGDDGRTLSLVQPNTDGLRAGERVRVSGGPRRGLARALP